MRWLILLLLITGCSEPPPPDDAWMRACMAYETQSIGQGEDAARRYCEARHP